MAALTKDEMELKLERLIMREVTLNDKIKHSSHHIDEYAGKSGILKTFDLGEDHEDIICLIEVISKVQGKKKEFTKTSEIWVNAKDLSVISKKES